MAKDFKVKDGEVIRTVRCKKASATVIEAGDIVTLSSGLIIKAVAGSTAIAYAPNAAGDGDTEVDVTIGNDFTLVGLKDADAVFAATQRGTLCDLKGTTDLIIDNDTSSTDVFKIGISQDAGVVDSKANIEVRINAPLF